MFGEPEDLDAMAAKLAEYEAVITDARVNRSGFTGDCLV